MKIDDQIELLKTIQKVEAPPFLYTRIEARLKNSVIEAPKNWKLAFVFSAILIVCLNVLIFQLQFKNQKDTSIEQLAKGMRLNSNNYFYHE